MIKKLIYLTYQTFPSETANTIQTIDNVKYFSRKNYNVEVIFPLRSKTSSDDINILKEYYSFTDEIVFKGIKHNLPFGKFKLGEKYLFILSHYLWSRKVCKKVKLEKNKNSQFFTRSDWIFYFLSKKNLNIIFECHQLSKTRKWVLKKSISKSKSKVIFLNNNLLLDSGINQKEYAKKIKVIQNGVDKGLFSEVENKEKHQIVFTGNLKRFNENRGLDFVINSFLSENMPKELSLKIIGGPSVEAKKLKDYVSKLGLDNKIEIQNRLSRPLTVSTIEKAGIGLLVNSSKNLHSVKYSSPLKYFEYLFAGLNIVAIDFPSHQNLPLANNISFFTENNQDSFINAIKKSLDSKPISRKELKSITMDSRVEKIISFINQ